MKENKNDNESKGRSLKLGDLISFSGSSFPIYPEIIKTFGLEPAVFLCRIIWYQDSADEWIEKSLEEIQAQTGLSPDRQRRARQVLVEAGVIDELYQRLIHRLRFRVLASSLGKELSAFPKPQNAVSRETAKPDMAKSENTVSSIGQDLRKDRKTRGGGGGSCGELGLAIVERWNGIEDLSKVQVLSPGRRKHFHQRLKDSHFLGNWEAAIQKVAESSFCRGENDRGWKADFDWFIKPDSVAKIMEGKYDNRPPRGQRPPSRAEGTANAKRLGQYDGIGKIE